MIPTDTSHEACEKQLELIAAMPPSQRVDLALQLSADLINLSKRAIKRIHPEFTDQEVGQMFVEIHYGKELADQVRQYQQKSKSS